MNRYARWAPAVAWMGAIFYLSSQSSPGTLPTPDYVVHGAVFGVLALAYLLGLAGLRLGPRSLLYAWGFAVLYGLTDEFHQSFVPGRHASGTDVLADAVGAGLLLGLAGYLVRGRLAGHAVSGQ